MYTAHREVGIGNSQPFFLFSGEELSGVLPHPLSPMTVSQVHLSQGEAVCPR